MRRGRGLALLKQLDHLVERVDGLLVVAGAQRELAERDQFPRRARRSRRQHARRVLRHGSAHVFPASRASSASGAAWAPGLPHSTATNSPPALQRVSERVTLARHPPALGWPPMPGRWARANHAGARGSELPDAARAASSRRLFPTLS